MRKVLLIGGGGFVGGYLANRLHASGEYNIALTHQGRISDEAASFPMYDLDLLQPAEIERVLADCLPDCIVHLAAQSSVGLSWKNPNLTVDVNVKGTLNLLDALRKLALCPRVLLIGSSEEYGAVGPEDNPVNEDHTLRPGNIYAITKACQNMIGSVYARAYSMDIVMVRAFNHIGPGQSPLFVISDFCKQVVEAEIGSRPPVMHVGNLSVKRDFTDVRDVVRAYELLLKRGVAGELYNVGSGKAVAIRDVLDMIVSKSTAPIAIEIDPDRFRPTDVPVIEADVGKLAAATGWQPEISLSTTIADTLDYWRECI